MNRPTTPRLDHPVAWPQTEQIQVPYRVFTDPRMFDPEQDQVLRGPHWHFVGLDAEVPERQDFKATFVGNTPVVVTRDRHGALRAWIDRCAHRGALVCRDRRGKAEGSFTCVYYQWAYTADGTLLGVPFSGGVGGEGGMPARFDPKGRRLQPLRVATYRGLIFTSFAAEGEVEPLESYLGAAVCKTLVGPGGQISLEGGEAIERMQQAIVRDGDASSYVDMHGRKGEPQKNPINEAPIVSYWEYYEHAMRFASAMS